MLENAGYVGLSHQMALRRQVDIIANNIANLNTTAYRGERALFDEFLSPTSSGRKISFVIDRGLIRDTSPGEFEPIGNPFDIAISERGFLVVETEAGPRYSRNGHLTTDAEGQLVTAEGFPVLDTDNRPLRINSGEGAVTIAGDGTVSSQVGPIGRLQIVRFENEQAMQKEGAALYRTDEEPTPVENPKVVQGMLERSNVRGIIEVTNMMSVMRSYQSTQRMVETEHDLQRRAIDKLGRASAA